jgi:NTP pyrophosphatase (non-canonical NTP hydrolase)
MADAPYRLTITELVDQSYKNSSQHGFWDDERTSETIPSKLALIMSEAGEALESYRDPSSDDLVPVPASVLSNLIYWAGIENADDSQRWKDCQKAKDALAKWNAKPKGFDIELADIMIRVADLAGALGIDLESAVQKKHAYNLGRPRKHGRVV